jgi:hypothetical protein
MIKNWGSFGTGADTAINGLIGDTPVRNWSGAGNIDLGEERLSGIPRCAIGYVEEQHHGLHRSKNQRIREILGFYRGDGYENQSSSFKRV